MNNTILVLGGAGYIGSHTVAMLRDCNFSTTVFDDLSEGHEAALLGAPLVKGNLLNRPALTATMRELRPAAVIHFAALCYVGESAREPSQYYANNVVGTLNVLEAMREVGCKNIVFSSSCATYGEPERMPIDEHAVQLPVNVYGRTKLVCEFLLRDFSNAYGINSVALRYFNAAGADPSGRMGEDHRPETHLIPRVLMAAAGRGPMLQVFGDDYPTSDGTCVRDYIHVTDLADAHVRAVRSLLDGEGGFRAFNVGNGHGVTVREVMASAAKIVGHPVPHAMVPRRPGDPPVLVGDCAKIERELRWRPKYSDLDSIMTTAWRWTSSHPHGYEDA